MQRKIRKFCKKRRFLFHLKYFGQENIPLHPRLPAEHMVTESFKHAYQKAAQNCGNFDAYNSIYRSSDTKLNTHLAENENSFT